MVKLCFIGHLGKDATVNQVNGKNVINFSAAHTEKYNDAQGVAQSKTTWVSFSHWTEKTGIVPYLTKGTQVYVEGQVEVNTFQRADQTTGAELKCRVFSVQLLGSPQGQQGQPAAQPGQPGAAPAPIWNGTAWVMPAAPVAQPPVQQPPVAPQPIWNGTAWVMPPAGQPAPNGFQPMDKMPF